MNRIKAIAIIIIFTTECQNYVKSMLFLACTQQDKQFSNSYMLIGLYNRLYQTPAVAQTDCQNWAKYVVSDWLAILRPARKTYIRRLHCNDMQCTKKFLRYQSGSGRLCGVWYHNSLFSVLSAKHTNVTCSTPLLWRKLYVGGNVSFRP